MRDHRRSRSMLALLAATALAACGTGDADPESDGDSQQGGYVETLGRAYRGGYADRTRGDMKAIAAAIGQRLPDAGDYPSASDMAGLAAQLEPAYIRNMPRTDAWDRPFLYQSTGEGYTLTSHGPDGAPGGGDDLVMTDAGFR